MAEHAGLPRDASGQCSAMTSQVLSATSPVESERSSETPVHATPRGLIGYSDAVADEIFRFQRTVFPERRTDWVVPRWNWMFLASAARLGVEPMVWLFRTAAGVVAHQGAIPVTVKTGGTERVTGWFVETAVLESVRGKAIGPMVISRANQDLPFNLSLGQTPEMRAIQFALGWQQVCPLHTYLFVLNARPVLQARFRNRWLRNGAAAALTMWQRMKYGWGRRRLAWTPVVSEIARFDATHTHLWNEVKGEYPCAVVRDESYLNWKYVDQPGQHFTRLGIYRDGQLAAIVVLDILQPSHERAYRRGALVDLVVRPSDRDAVWAVLDVARKALQTRGADLMAFDLASAALSGAVRSFGFLRDEPNRVFLIATGDSSPDVRTLVTSPDSWLLTRGDSDIDRPW
jgi:hypothetical protein